MIYLHQERKNPQFEGQISKLQGEKKQNSHYCLRAYDIVDDVAIVTCPVVMSNHRYRKKIFRHYIIISWKATTWTHFFEIVFSFIKYENCLYQLSIKKDP